MTVWLLKCTVNDWAGDSSDDFIRPNQRVATIKYDKNKLMDDATISECVGCTGITVDLHVTVSTQTDMFTVHIKPPTGAATPIRVLPTDTVRLLKRMMEYQMSSSACAVSGM